MYSYPTLMYCFSFETTFVAQNAIAANNIKLDINSRHLSVYDKKQEKPEMNKFYNVKQLNSLLFYFVLYELIWYYRM